MKNNISQNKAPSYGFTFGHVVDEEINAYPFRNGQEKQEFISRFKAMIAGDEVLWRDIVMGIEILVDDVATDMNIERKG